MPYIQGFLIEGADPGYGNRPGGPVDPGYGRPGGGHIDNSLPPGVPPIGVNLPEPPPGIWPPPDFTRPIVPANPPGIDNTLPVQPGTIWPSPGRPTRPDHSLPGSGGRPDAGLPTPPSGTLPARPPARPDNTLPGGGSGQIDNTLPSQTFWMLCYAPSLGWKFVSVDPSLEVGMPLPPAPAPKG